MKKPAVLVCFEGGKGFMVFHDDNSVTHTLNVMEASESEAMDWYAIPQYNTDTCMLLEKIP